MSQFNFEIELIKVYSDMKNYLYRYQSSLTEFEREDLLHESILKIIEKQHAFKIEGDYKFYKFRGWCLKIIHNTFINNYRINKRLTVDSYDENPLLLFENEPITFSADEELLTSELYETIIKIEKNIINRKIFFGYMNGISYDALAEIFDLPLGTLKSRLFNTRKKIKQALLQDLNCKTNCNENN